MFKKVREITNENGVKSMEEYNPVKEKLKEFGAKTVEIGYDALEIVVENSNYIHFVLGCSCVFWLLGYKNGHDNTHKVLIERYKNGGTVCTMSDIFFKKKMSFDDWMKYIEHGYNTKKGWKKKNVLKYLRENGFID